MPPIDRALRAAPHSLLPRIIRLPSSLLLTHHQQTRTIKATFGPQPTRFNTHPSLPILTSSSTAAYTRKLLANTLPLRTGALALKKGMISLYNATTGFRTPATVLQLDRNEVLALKRRATHGYNAVQIGAGFKTPENTSRPLLGHFAKAGTSPKRWIAEFRVRDEEGLLSVGERVSAGWFREGQFVDVRSTSRGMGFAGGMKKWGWKGQPASHGQSLTHRTMGSAGGSQGSGSRVIPGKKMAGRMGNERRTIQNLKVLRVDEGSGIVVVNGCIAGPKGCVVKLQDALKKDWPDITVAQAEGVAEQTTA